MDFFVTVLIVLVFAVISAKYWDAGEKFISLINEDPKCILPLIITVTGMLIGFALTGLTILLTLSDTGKLGVLVKNKHFSDIFKTYRKAIKAMSGIMVVAIGSLLLGPNSKVDLWFFYGGLFSTLLALFRLYRCIWFMKLLIKIVIKNAKINVTCV